MENKVWNILQKEKWTEEGQQIIEQLHDAMIRIFEKADKSDIQILSDGIDQHLYEVMDIIGEYLS